VLSILGRHTLLSSVERYTMLSSGINLGRHTMLSSLWWHTILSSAVAYRAT